MKGWRGCGSFKKFFACCRLPRHRARKREEARRFSIAPLELNYCFSVIATSDGTQAKAIARRRSRCCAPLHLNENHLEEIAAFEKSIRWMCRVLANRDDIDNTAPLALSSATKRHKSPPVRDTRAQCSKDDLRPTARRMSLDVSWGRRFRWY